MMLRRTFLIMFTLSLCATASANENFYAAMVRGDLQEGIRVLRTGAFPSLESQRLKALLVALPSDQAKAIVAVIQERMATQDENESSTQADGRDRRNSRYVSLKQMEALAAQVPESVRPVFWFAVQFGQSVNKNPQ